MKKKLAILCLFFTIPLFSTAMPRAEASALEDSLAAVLAGKPAANQIEELLTIQTSLLAQQLATQDLNGVKTNIVKAVETAVRDKLQSKVQTEITSRLAQYQDEVVLLTALLKNNNTLTPQVVQNNNALVGEPQNYQTLLNMTATAYAPGPLDNDKWNDLTYVGSKVKKGVVAVDPAVIPMGTKLWVEGYGEALAEDQGRAIKGNRIDLAFNTRQEALDYGIKNVKVYVLK